MYEEIGKHHLPMCAVLTCPVLWWPHGLQPTMLICPWGFSRQEYCSGLPFPPPGDLPDPGIKPRSPASPALAGRFFYHWATWETLSTARVCVLKSLSRVSLWPHGLQPTRLICPWGFSRQEYWSGLPCPPPRDLPNPGDWIQVSHLAGGFFTIWATRDVNK